MFHAGVCKSIGIRRVEAGVKDELGGVIGGATAPIYFHKVKIFVGSEQIETMAGFSWQLSVAGLLGRRGFFENFSVHFDPTLSPPIFEVERVHRA